MSTKFTQDFNNKKCRVIWQHSYFFHEPVFSNSLSNAAHSDTVSVTHDSVYLHCNNMTCLSTLNVWQTALFFFFPKINTKITRRYVKLIFFFFEGPSPGLSALQFWLYCRWPCCQPKRAKDCETTSSSFATRWLLPSISLLLPTCPAPKMSAGTYPLKCRHICYIYHMCNKNEKNELHNSHCITKIILWIMKLMHLHVKLDRRAMKEKELFLLSAHL